MMTHCLHTSMATLLAGLMLGGCATSLVHDDVHRTVALEGHCSGGEWVDDSSIAVLPVPVVAFFVPHADLHELRADEYLGRCGEPTRLVNRSVEVTRTACIPAGLTRIVTLGVWQWCPAYVNWEADLSRESNVDVQRSTVRNTGGLL